MTLVNDANMSEIFDNLSENDQNVVQESKMMDEFQQDDLLPDAWHSDDLLENIFSLERGSLDFLDETMPEPDFNLPMEHTQPFGVNSSSCSDSGLSGDQADFDFEQQLSPFLIENTCDYETATVAGEPASLDGSASGISEICSSPAGSVEEVFDILDFEQNVVPSFINGSATNQTFHTPGKPKKRRLSSTPPVAVQPKVQKATIKVTSSGQKPQLVVKGQPQKPVKVSNIQVINPQTKVYSKPVESVAPQRRVIRVAPMAGNPRSILLPVTIKDMKDLKSIKIINAADFKNVSNIKLAAANLLSQNKKQEKIESRHDYDYDNNCDDSSSDRSDDEDEKDSHVVVDARNGYPRLVLTAEERRLLAKEGISLPTSYPLTKHEERELKRIRRKIRNKISAQDSRKRKKEYVDGLEDRVKQCTAENQTLIRRIKILQSQNQSLSTQLRKLQSVMSGMTNASLGKSTQPATCLLVLLMSVALVALPSMQEEARGRSEPPAPPAPVSRTLLSTTKMKLEEAVIDDGEFHMEELITFNRPHSDHDYQVVKNIDVQKALPGGYVDIPIDEDWPPNLKKRMKKLEFDYEDGRDYLPVIKEDGYDNMYLPVIKEEGYEHFYKLGTTLDEDNNLENGLITNTLLATGKTIGGILEALMPVPVKSEDLVIEEISDYDTNTTDIKSFITNTTVDDII